MSDTGPERIAAGFAGAAGRAALMPYLMGGFPTVAESRRVGLAYADGGADLVELGVPFSDPLADGPVIHAAGTRALREGTTLHDVLEVGMAIAERIPVVLMCYANVILARGIERLAHEMAARRISGLIVPDLPLEEAPVVLGACDAAGVAVVPLVAPTTPEDRLKAIGARARGFLYTVSVTGTTGERAQSDPAAVLARAKACTKVPVALGFGISNPEQAAAAAAAGADGVIVGTRLVRAVAEADEAGEDPAAAARAVVADLAAGLSR